MEIGWKYITYLWKKLKVMLALENITKRRARKRERERERERERSVLFNVEALYSGLEDLETFKRRFKDLKSKKA